MELVAERHFSCDGGQDFAMNFDSPCNDERKVYHSLTEEVDPGVIGCAENAF